MAVNRREFENSVCSSVKDVFVTQEKICLELEGSH